MITLIPQQIHDTPNGLCYEFPDLFLWENDPQGTFGDTILWITYDLFEDIEWYITRGTGIATLWRRLNVLMPPLELRNN